MAALEPASVIRGKIAWRLHVYWALALHVEV